MIEHVRVIPIDIPEKEPKTLAYGTIEVRQNVLIKIVDSNGEVGVGECAPIPMRDGCEVTQRTVVDLIENEVAPLALGQDPWNIFAIMEAVRKRIGLIPYASAGFVDALYDLSARLARVPLWRQLGGSHRASVPASWSIGFKDSTEEAAEEASWAMAQGFRWLKVKIGRGADPDVLALEAIRRAVGDQFPIHVDANASFTYAEALPVLRRLETFDLALIEQPLPRDAMRDMARLRRSLSTPLMADESVVTASDMLELLRLEAADAVLIKLAKNGGIHGSREIATLAKAGGLMVYPGVHRSTSIGTAASAHFFAGLLNITPGDFHVGPRQLAHDVVLRSVETSNGRIKIPQGPGTGVDLDDSLVARAQKRHEDARAESDASNSVTMR